MLHRQQPLQVHELQQAKFQVKALFLPEAQIVKGAQHDLEKAGQLLLSKQSG